MQNPPKLVAAAEIMEQFAEEEGRNHPTAGGLRIGKTMPESQLEENFDQGLEWERELAEAAHKGFTYKPKKGGPKRMYWKMSLDLSRPLVTVMARHDPLDGYLTCLGLEESAPGVLQRQVKELGELCRNRDWTTDDPLAIGLQTLPLLKNRFTANRIKKKDADTALNLLEALSVYENMGVEIEDFWLDAKKRTLLPWTEHSHINMVMLTTSLIPGGFLKK